MEEEPVGAAAVYDEEGGPLTSANIVLVNGNLPQYPHTMKIKMGADSVTSFKGSLELLGGSQDPGRVIISWIQLGDFNGEYFLCGKQIKE